MPIPSMAVLCAAGGDTAPPFDPINDIDWYHAVWAEDPNFLAPADSAAVPRIHNSGSSRVALNETHINDTNGMYVPAKNTYAGRVEHKAAYNITDLDVRVLLKLDDWTPATVARGIIEKRITNSVTTDLSWEVAVRTDGTFQVVWVTTGATVVSAISTASSGVTDGTAKWVRFTVDVDNGASQHEVKFYLSDDGSSWAQLGSTVTTSGTTSIRTNSSPLSFGVAGVSADAVGIGGYFQRAILLDGIGGTEILDIDFTGHGTDISSFVEQYGETVYIESNMDLIQTTANRQPLYKSSVAALNSRPALLGDGSNDYIATAVQASTTAQSYSLVAIIAGAASGKAVMHAKSSNSGWAFYWNGADTRWWAFAGSVLATTATNTADSGAHLMAFVANGASSKILEDGNLLVTGAGGSNAADIFGLFDIGTVNFPFGGHIAFAGLYVGDITADGNWTAFKSWAASLYNLTVV